MKKVTQKIIRTMMTLCVLISLNGCAIKQYIQNLVTWEIGIVDQHRFVAEDEDYIVVNNNEGEYVWVVNKYQGLVCLDIVDCRMRYDPQTEIIEYGKLDLQSNEIAWSEYEDEVICVYINIAYDETPRITSMDSWFKDMRKLVRVSINGLKTAENTSAENLFCDCSNLREIYLNYVDFSGITNAKSMFKNCSMMMAFDLSKFTNPNIDIESIFEGCTQLTTVMVSTSAVANQLPTKYHWYNNKTEFIPGESDLFENGESSVTVKLSCNK